MTDPEQNDLPELELDLIDTVGETSDAGAPSDGAEVSAAASDTAPDAHAAHAANEAVVEAPAVVEAAAPAGADGDPEQGQWVWQYGAPPPPPSFGASFFSGNALPELYRFFGCALLVVIGCLLPWGPVSESTSMTLEDGTVAVSEKLMSVPNMIGAETTLGALSLLIGLWLLFSSCYSIYTRRQKILPVFLMIEPAIISWTRLLATNDQAADLSFLEMLDAAGTGVLLTLVGSSFVSLQFFMVVAKVTAKKEEKAPRRASAKAAEEGADGSDKKKAAGKKDPGSKGKRGRKKS
ncbi:MAG: hypothetical protein ACI9EF_000009 [Pseudohongiellaceae bacterium]